MTKSLLEVESDMILGKGAFGRCVKCRVKDKYKGISVLNKQYFAMSNLINGVKAMLSLIRHSGLPMPIKTFMERDPTLTQFIGFSQESLALDNCSRRLTSITWSCRI